MIAFAASFMLVVLAEMGDKTQLLAMAFAMKYSTYKVLLAIFLATLLSNALAVTAGHFLTVVIPIDIISFVASLSFIIFGIWIIRGDGLEKQDKKESKFGPILTVGTAFFIAEMGDKTQLATISLAVKYQNILGVLMGTTLAMVVADAIGIIFGRAIHKRVSEEKIKWVAAAIFILFGIIGIYGVLSTRMVRV
ncbi:MAG: TMEM165/GDT1 family protein [Candidatus Omnitrophica bacterium]|nr:TMEM165/GDT1 family protein [Candidatus Omnitrophota bacterium]